jgi:acyl-CoA thioesterase
MSDHQHQFEFDRATAIDEGGRGWIHDGWDINGNANGGYLLALAGNGLRAVAGRPDPVSVTAHFLSPGKPGDVLVDARTIKQGKRFTTVAGTMWAGDRVALQLVGTFGELATSTEEDASYMAEGPPELPPIDECVPRTSAGPFPVPFMDRLDVRLRPSDVGFITGDKSGVAETAGWLSFADARPIDTLALLLVADAFPPAVFNLHLEAGWVPTVEMTVHVRARPVPGPLRCVFRTRFVTGEMFEEDGEVWDSSGALVALSRQLALMPRIP